MPDESNGRVTIAVLGEKLDSMASVQVQTNARLVDVAREVGEIRREIAVNEERWTNHRDRHEKDRDAHKDLHNRERGIVGTVIAVANTVSGVMAAWWGSR